MLINNDKKVRLRLLLVMLICSLSVAYGADPLSLVKPSDTYPWKVQANTNLNVRSGMGTEFARIGVISKGTYFKAVDQKTSDWVEIEYEGQRAYVSSKYITFLYQIPTKETNPPQNEKELKNTLSGIGNVLLTILNIALGIILVLIVIVFIDYIIEIVKTSIGLGLLLGIIFLIFGGKFSNGFYLGAAIGAIIVVGTYIRELNYDGVLTFADGLIPKISFILYFIVSTPAYYIERTHSFMMKPWRFFVKGLKGNEMSRPIWRVVLSCIQIPLYVILTPLRAALAIYYNLVIHVTLELAGYLLEVIAPEDKNEGRSDIWMWLLKFPFRVLKYPIGHGLLTIIESAIFTIVDIFDPAGTLYHGTDDVASDSITSDPNRNNARREASNRFSGTFKSSDSVWAGNGVYFAPGRHVSFNYATDPYRCNGDPCVIVCRATFGKTIDFGLSTFEVFYNTGMNGQHSKITSWCLDQHHYVTGEWWNPNGHYWEYCMFDWRNRYNHPWRIRPVYVFNLRTGFFKRVPGGMAHWLFREEVLKDIFGSL